MEHTNRAEIKNFYPLLVVFFTSITGGPTWEDIEVIDKHICQLADVVETNKEEIVKLGNDFATFSKAANDRMDTLEDGMININKRVTETNQKLIELSQQVQTGLTKLEKKVSLSISGTNLLFKVQEQLYKFQEEIHILSSTVEEFGRGINVLMSGRLPPQIINTDSVELIIDIITDKLLARGDRTKLINQNPSGYYILNDVVFTRSDKMNSIFIMLNFPIFSRGGLMASYRVDKIFLSLKEDTVSSSQIADLPDFFAVSHDGLYYTEY